MTKTDSQSLLKPRLFGKNLEKHICSILSAADKPVSRKQLLENLSLDHAISYNTVRTKLKHLEDSGFIVKLPDVLYPTNCFYFYIYES
ncbi:MAG: winged-helix domain-containing protein [Candidatus Heimdallarchaeaceae archaeon]